MLSGLYHFFGLFSKGSFAVTVLTVDTMYEAMKIGYNAIYYVMFAYIRPCFYDENN